MAIPTLTIYSTSADLTTLYAVLNGVAMICKEDAWIWGFALVVAMWRLLASSTSAVLRSPGGQGAAVLGHGAFNTLMPFILAMTLTNPMLKGTVQLEATVNGAVTEVDNVTLVISAIQAAGSILSMDLNAAYSTAFQTVDADYPAISASANGFLNPLKVLLTSRTAMVRLGGVDSEVKTVLAACLGPDSGVNYASIQNLVQNAGNTGATSAQSISINGLNPTALGALLYQASLNTNGMVNDPGLSSTQILSCSDAAYKVADDITDALNSVEFTRVIQGAVNGMDQPLPGADYSFNTVAAQYSAVTRANTLGNVFSGGTGQANAEFMNLLFSEIVETNLNCLKASSDTLVECQATALQAAEVERNNLQQAASEVPMLRYAGSFGNYLLAMIIGLGPAIVMLMMFAGIEAGKCVKTVAHIIVWPLLVVNVGAELVNSMICVDVANYLQSLRQGGWISQASTLSAYKELSLQIGVGSHIMASLPVLMSLIFGLGESSAMTSVATTIAPKGRDTADNLAPAPESTRPMFENSAVGTISQTGNGSGRLAMTGSLNAVSTSNTFGNSVREAARSLTESDTRSRALTAGESNLADIRSAISSGNYQSIGLDRQVGEALARNFNAEQRTGNDMQAGGAVTGVRSNSNQTSAGGGGSASFSNRGLRFNVGAHGDTATSANDSLQDAQSRTRNENYNDSVAMSRALSKTMSEFQNTSAGQRSSSELSKSLSIQQSYQKTLSEVQSVSDSASQGVRDTSSMVNMSSTIGATELAWQQRSNSEYAAFQLTSGRQFSENSAVQPYIAKAESDAASGATDRVVGDRDAQDAVNRHRAAVMMAQDEKAAPADRLAAARYLADEGRALQHMRFEPNVNSGPMNLDIGKPVDGTGVDGGGLANAAGARMHGPMVGAIPSQRAPASVPQAHPTAHPAAAHLAPAHPGSRVPNAPALAGRPQELPKAADPNFNLAPDLQNEVQSRVAGGRHNVEQAVTGAERLAADSGLDANGHGTVIRTAANVADNVVDVGRKDGQSSRTRLGNTDRVEKPADKPAAQQGEPPKSHFVRRGPGGQ